MPLTKYNNYKLFVGPCYESGLNFLTLSGLLAHGPISLWSEYGAWNNISIGVENIALTSGENFGYYSNALNATQATNIKQVLYSGCFPVNGTYAIYGEYFIPASNTGVIGIGFKESLNDDLIINGRNKGIWTSFDYDGYFESGSILQTILLSSGHSNNATDWPQPLTGSAGESIYVKNLRVINNSGIPYVNLISQLDKVFACDIRWNPNLSRLSDFGFVDGRDEKNLFYTEGSITFSYWSADLSNEFKLGLNVGHNSVSGTPLQVSGNILTFLTGYNFNNDYLYPFGTQQYKNFYLVNNNSTDDLTIPITNNNHFNTISVGNCYLQNYSVRLNVRSLPETSCTFGFYNLQNTPGIMGPSPTLSRESGNYYSGSLFLIPTIKTNLAPVLPTRSIGCSLQGTQGLFNLTGLLIQSCDLSIDLSSQQNLNMGYALPASRRIEFPIIASLNINAVITEDQYALLSRQIQNNRSYHIDINYQGCQDNYITYQCRGANLEGLQTNYSVNNLRNISLNFTQEIFQQSATQGLFISGVLARSPSGINLSLNPIASLNHRPSIDYVLRTGNNLLLYW